MNSRTPTIDGLRKAVEGRDAESLKSLYAGDCVLTIIDSDNPPSRPRTLKGAKEIGEFLDDVYSRDMTHTIESGIVDGKTLAFVQGCRYSDGTRVIASSIADLGPGGIIRQTTVQAWDN